MKIIEPVSKICPTCERPRLVLEITILGVPKELLGDCQCVRDAEAARLLRSGAALRLLVDEFSTLSPEFATAMVREHPNKPARDIAVKYLTETVPKSFVDPLLSLADWHAATPDDRGILKHRQRKAVQGIPGVGFYGLPGRGKSGIANAILREYRSRGISTCAVNVRMLLDECKARYGDRTRGTVDALFESLRLAPVLLLDDIDKANENSQDEIGKLYSVTEARMYNSMPTLVTSNRDIVQLEKLFRQRFGENGVSIIDRLAKLVPDWHELKADTSYRLARVTTHQA